MSACDQYNYRIRIIDGTTGIARTWIVCTVQFRQLCVLIHPICLSPCGRSSSGSSSGRGEGWMWQETGCWAAASPVRVSQFPAVQCHRPGWWSLDFCSMSSLMVRVIFLTSNRCQAILYRIAIYYWEVVWGYEYIFPFPFQYTKLVQECLSASQIFPCKSLPIPNAHENTGFQFALKLHKIIFRLQSLW